jgi:transposase-like protein
MPSERIVKDICRATRKQYSAEEKIRIVLDGLRGEHSIAELCRREGIAERALNAEIDHHLDNGEEDGRPIAGMAMAENRFSRKLARSSSRFRHRLKASGGNPVVVVTHSKT